MAKRNDDEMTDVEREEEEAASTPKTGNRSLSVSTELYDQVQHVRQQMEDAGPCKCCGHDPGKVPLKAAAEKIVQLGIDRWQEEQTKKAE